MRQEVDVEEVKEDPRMKLYPERSTIGLRFDCTALVHQINLHWTVPPDLVNLCVNDNLCAKLSECWQRPSCIDGYFD